MGSFEGFAAKPQAAYFASLLLGITEQLAEVIDFVGIEHALVGFKELPERGLVNFHFKPADT
jgi:hypothetical protein